MLRSSAGNFYNYFRPGAGELIRSTEPRRFLSLSSSLPHPWFLLRPPLCSIDLSFFLLLLSPLPAPSSRLSNHARLSVVVPSSISFRPFFFSSDFSLPFVLVYQFLCLSRYCFESDVALPRESTHAEYQNIWVVYLPRSSPSSDTMVIIVRHLLEVVPSRPANLCISGTTLYLE